MPYTVTFICTGNTCRSAMGEAITKSLLLPYKNIKVDSCGIQTTTGTPASVNSKIVSKQNGIDLNKHRSRKMTYKILQNSNLILCMEDLHMDRIISLYPEFKDKIFRLKSWMKVSKPTNGNKKIQHPTVKTNKSFDSYYDKDIWNSFFGDYDEENYADNIPDPYGGNLKEYEMTFKEIYQEVKRVVPFIIAAANKGS